MMSQFMNLSNDAIINVTEGRNPTTSVINRKEARALERLKMCRNARDDLPAVIEETLNALNKHSMCLGICFMKSNKSKLIKFKEKYEAFVSMADRVVDVYQWPLLKQELTHSSDAQVLMDYILKVKDACSKVIEPNMDREEVKEALRKAHDIIRGESEDHFQEVAKLMTD